MVLRDSTSAADIPLQGLDAVAGYGDGLYQWSSADWARFPGTIVALSIVVNAADVGDILDIERGDATPADAPGWCDRFERPGRRAPTLYVNRANWPDVIAAVGPRKADYWVSTLDGTTDVPGAVAVQAWGSDRTGGHYDESLILDPSWLSLGGEPEMDPVLLQKLDIALNLILSGQDARAAGAWLPAQLAVLEGDQTQLSALVQAQASQLQAVQQALAELKAGPSDPATAAAIARIEKALQGA